MLSVTKRSMGAKRCLPWRRICVRGMWLLVIGGSQDVGFCRLQAHRHCWMTVLWYILQVFINSLGHGQLGLLKDTETRHHPNLKRRGRTCCWCIGWQYILQCTLSLCFSCSLISFSIDSRFYCEYGWLFFCNVFQ